MPYKDPDAQRRYQNEWMKRRRQAWLAENGPCVDCESWDDLEVDHVDQTTKTTHRVWSWSDERRFVELAKCVARCAPCHLLKSKKEKVSGEDHSRCKLTDQDLNEIRQAFDRGTTTTDLALKYGVHIRTVQCIVYRSGLNVRYRSTA